MEEIAKILNLASHPVGVDGEKLPSAADLEGHQVGNDYYLVGKSWLLEIWMPIHHMKFNK